MPSYGERGHFFSGTWPHQMYVEYQFPAGRATHETPIILFHGAASTGASYWTTPAGKKGWAHHFVEGGWSTYVVDWPGHGRSGFGADFRDLRFDVVVDAAVDAVKRVGPAVMLTGSMSGPIGWKVAEHVPDLVLAILSWAPAAPGNVQPVESHVRANPDNLVIHEDLAEMRRRFVAGPLFDEGRLVEYRNLHVPESPALINQRYNYAGSAVHIDDRARILDIPKLILTSENDPGHPRHVDEATAAFVGAEFVYLADAGMPGHSHEMMLDDENEELAIYMMNWLLESGVK